MPVFAFRVAAPMAGKGTSFKENQGSASGTVMHRKTLNIKHHTGQFGLTHLNSVHVVATMSG